MVLTANVIRGLTGGIDANAITFGTLSNARLPSSISGNGVGLYGLSASNVSTGTIDNARLPSTITSNFVGSGAGLTNINGANVSGVLDADLVWMAGTIDGSLTIADRLTANTVVVSNGSASAPSVTFAGNMTTGMYLPTANTIGFTTAGTERMRIDNVGNIIAKGIIRNIYTQSNTTTFASITTTYIDGPIFDVVTMSANSKVKVYVYIPWRNGNTAGTFGGMYVDVQFRVNVNVGSYVANSYVSLGISGFQMITGAEEMLQYTNEFYLPFTIPSDFTLQFKYRVASYDGTASIGNGYNSYAAGNVLLAQFGILDSQMYPKIIITEIGG